MDFSAILEQIQNWFNTNVTVANLSGIINTLIIFGLAYINNKIRKKSYGLTVDVDQSSKKADRLENRINSQSTEIHELTETIDLLTQMVFRFINGTKVTGDVKEEVSKIYGKASDLLGNKKAKKEAEKAEEEAKVIKAEEIKIKEQDLAEEKEISAYQKLKNSIEKSV